MNEITKKLHSKVMESFRPFAEKIAEEGCYENQIVAAFQAQMKINTNQYYANLKAPRRMGAIISNLDLQKYADSKAEIIFMDMLANNGIKFKFQHPIGPYRADFLIKKQLVVEIDGPQHNKDHDAKRDKYIKKMGYTIFRVPLWILTSSPEAVIAEIKEHIT